MINKFKTEATMRMEKCILAFNFKLKKINTGRASPNFIDTINVDYYGITTPLRNLANIVTEDSRTLALTVFDRTSISTIEKTIINSDLGINPITSGSVIRIKFPYLTEERRNNLSKLVKREAEQCRIAVRNIRRDINLTLKSLLKKNNISEDEEHRTQDIIQKITDNFIKKVDLIMSNKVKELMEF
ncbi:MAG: ribosome recycling factor [Candidatus Dasytiphilus stammeri]